MATRLGVIQTPSLSETAWAAAIVEQATVLGIGVVDVRDGTIPEDFDRSRTRVVLATTQEVAEATLHPTDWLVIRDTPAMARWLMATASGEPIGSRLVATMTSHRLTIADAVAKSASATVVDAAGLTADVPLLGPFRRGATDWAGPAPDTEAGALAMLQDGATAQWPLSLFYFPKGDDVEGGTPEFDLTGRARLLMFGPYIHLPPGTWAIDVEFEIDPQQREVPLRLEWGAGTDYVEVSDAVREAGVYTITLERYWPVAEAAQFRLWLTQARFQGHLRVVGCRVRRTPDQSVAAGPGRAAELSGPASDRPIISA